MMDDNLRDRIIGRLESDYSLKQAAGTGWHRQGRCPACGKKELYVNSEAPWVMRCGRINKCGTEWRIQELYQDLFNDWSERFKADQMNPKATAYAYLSFGRGFEPTVVHGEFTQETYFDRASNAGSATVRFPLPGDGWWERLIDRPERFGKLRARIKPGHSYKGTVWSPACVDMATVEEIWVTEGIFDAFALIHARQSAVSSISASNFPDKWLESVRAARPGALPKIIFALDGDNAGTEYARKHVRAAREMGFQCTAAVIHEVDGRGKRRDWNDLWQLGRLDDAYLKVCRHHGAVLLAATAVEKGRLMYAHSGRQQFWFPHSNRTYYWHLDLGKFDKAMEQIEQANQGITDEQVRLKAIEIAGTVKEIANCYPHALYHQRNEITDESWYYIRIRFPHDGQEQKVAFTPTQISTAGDFKKRLLAMPGAYWMGSQGQLDDMMKNQTYQIKSVGTIDFQGYSKNHETWVLGRHAICKGQLYEVNEEDYFEIGKTRLKSLMGMSFEINPAMSDYRKDWFSMLWTCFNEQGVIALAFWFGSLFAEQIRSRQKSFPFLEITGEAGAGKTTLIKFLWKLLGRGGDYEGFDPSKSTVPGRARNMSQVSGMPIVLIEADRNEPDRMHSKSFDWDELKDFYGGGTIRSRGMRTGGNETYEPAFKGTIAIAQNADVSASEAILTRIVKLGFKRPKASTESRAAAQNLEGMEIEHLSQFVLMVTKAEQSILAKFDIAFKRWEARLRGLDTIRIERIVKNHAQIGALVDCVADFVAISPDQLAQVHGCIERIAVSRQDALSADHPLVAEFWDVFEYLDNKLASGANGGLNHSGRDDQIALSLNEVAEMAGFHRQQMADIKILRALLKNSRRHKFVESNVSTYSRLKYGAAPAGAAGNMVKCWVFKRGEK